MFCSEENLHPTKLNKEATEKLIMMQKWYAGCAEKSRDMNVQKLSCYLLHKIASNISRTSGI